MTTIAAGFRVITYQANPQDKPPKHLEAACTLLNAEGTVVCYLHAATEDEALAKMTRWVEAGAEKERKRRKRADAAAERMRTAAETRKVAREAIVSAPDVLRTAAEAPA